MIVHPHGSVVFCDDIRHENNGKLLLIGVYQNDILFDGPTPWLLGGLWCHIRYVERFPDPDVKLPNLTIAVTRRDEGAEEQEIASIPISEIERTSIDSALNSTPSISDSIRLFQTAAGVRLGAQVFERPSRLRVVMKRNDESILLGSLLVNRLVRADAPT